MRKDPKHQRTRNEDDKMSTFSHVMWITLKTEKAYICWDLLDKADNP